MKLTLESASLIVDKALAKAREAKFRPMCVAVLDDGGHVKVLKREDGASILRPNIAESSDLVNVMVTGLSVSIGLRVSIDPYIAIWPMRSM